MNSSPENLGPAQIESILASMETVQARTGGADPLQSRLALVSELLAGAPKDFATPALVYRDANRAVRVKPISDELTVGRSKECSICFPNHREISRRHFTITGSPGLCALTDHGSSNGTFVNDARVIQRELIDGDIIEAGDFVFVFVRE